MGGQTNLKVQFIKIYPFHSNKLLYYVQKQLLQNTENWASVYLMIGEGPVVRHTYYFVEIEV